MELIRKEKWNFDTGKWLRFDCPGCGIETQLLIGPSYQVSKSGVLNFNFRCVRASKCKYKGRLRFYGWTGAVPE